MTRNSSFTSLTGVCLTILTLIAFVPPSFGFLVPPNVDIPNIEQWMREVEEWAGEAWKALGDNGADGVGVARFDDHQVWRVQVDAKAQLEALQYLSETGTIDLWSNLRYGPVDFRVAKGQGVERVRKTLDIVVPPLQPAVLIENVQALIEAQNAPDIQPVADESGDQRVLGLVGIHDAYFRKYHTIEEITEYYDSLANTYPDLVEPFTVGKTYEGREIRGIHIHNKNSSKLNEVKDFVFHGGIHAREWIGPAVVTYIATQLILKNGEDQAVTDLLSKYRFSIIPVLNVDGYVFTHNNNRMWRKNRQPNSLPWCIGTDPNRNWGYKWGEGGASGNPCSEAYQGPSAFSTPEAKNMADYLKRRAPNVSLYIDFHAYSQLWMSPYGADCDRLPEEHEKIQAAGEAAASALKAVHGTKFAVGPICEIIYRASGSSVDWAYAEANVTYSYAVELRDTGRYGFLLPPSLIVPSGEETFAGFLALAKHVAKDEEKMSS
ncbi:hypothetical protein HK104_011156 [Borealophlyctis nickersoniae]|nr:hypothetical protein HK104_011156 [Borealophlyctis nickersoniae]